MVTYIVIYSIFQLTFVCFLVLLIDSEKLICYLWFQFSLQTDMTRRQLEYEARQIRAAMEEQLGTCQDMEKRAQVNGVSHTAHITALMMFLNSILQLGCSSVMEHLHLTYKAFSPPSSTIKESTSEPVSCRHCLQGDSFSWLLAMVTSIDITLPLLCFCRESQGRCSFPGSQWLVSAALRLLFL